MKRLIFLIAAVLVFLGIQFLVNCSNPLESLDGSHLTPPGPVIDIDTLYDIDTVIVIDSNNVVDTVIIIDTTTVVDTVVVIDTNAVVDTVVVIDTNTVVDTVVVIDSNTVVDTVVVIDTITVVDTLIIIEPEPGESQTVCSRIASNQGEIVWIFRNQEGTYLLEFDASLESEHPTQILSVEIDGQEFLWTPAENAEFITELYLKEHTVIRITPHKPPSLGHAVYICLKVSKPEA